MCVIYTTVCLYIWYLLSCDVFIRCLLHVLAVVMVPDLLYVLAVFMYSNGTWSIVSWLCSLHVYVIMSVCVTLCALLCYNVWWFYNHINLLLLLLSLLLMLLLCLIGWFEFVRKCDNGWWRWLSKVFILGSHYIIAIRLHSCSSFILCFASLWFSEYILFHFFSYCTYFWCSVKAEMNRRKNFHEDRKRERLHELQQREEHRSAEFMASIGVDLSKGRHH